MKKKKLQMISAMAIFGTLGIFVARIPMSSPAIAFCRGLVGCVCLGLFLLLTGKKLSLLDIKKNLLLLVLSGIALGFNWILLFEAYRYTTVATATMCYYLAPMFLLLVSPLFGEKLTGKKLLCVGIALLGMVFVSGVLEGKLPEAGELMGIALGVGAAVLYTTVIVLNKKLGNMKAFDKTACQLGLAAVVILPYLLLTGDPILPAMELSGWLSLALVCVVHTGIAYVLYFGSVKELPSQNVAIYSYLDPVLSIFLSALVLRQTVTVMDIVGAVLILGSALYSELS